MKKILFAMTMLLSACSGGTGSESNEPQQYELLTVKTQNHELETGYAAQVRGAQDIRIVPRVEGYLQEIKVKEGQQVKQGQLLFVIDQVAYRAAVKTAQAAVLQAEALLAKAQQDYEGKQMLHEQQVTSEFDLRQTKRDMDIAQANLAAARAELDAARNNLSFTELRSPSDGVIGRLPYRKGDYVGPATSEGLTVVSDNRQMYVYFSLSEARVMEYLTQYTSMQDAINHMPAVTLALPNGKNYEEQGKVESVSGIVDQQTGAVSVRAVFPNESGLLLSGGTARVIMPSTYTNVIVIPQEATYEIQNKVFIYKVKNGVAESAMIEVEKLNDGSLYIVRKGLEPGDVIVGKGARFVREGTKVKG